MKMGEACIWKCHWMGGGSSVNHSHGKNVVGSNEKRHL
jgi:hypothetical protein